MFEITDLRYQSILNLPHLVLDRQITCLTGPSGSGKTTLLRCLNRLVRPERGSIRYQGENLFSLDPVALRRRVIMLAQTPILYEGTVEDNLQIGRLLSQRTPASRTSLCAALEQAQLALPLDSTCVNLSGGEKQRLCLARVLLMEAETYLLDEPSSALDQETEQKLIDTLAAFSQEHGCQLIMVTHSEEIASRYREGLIKLTAGETEGYLYE